MKGRTRNLMVRFTRSVFAPGGTVPLEEVDTIRSMSRRLALALIESGYARRLNEEELEQFRRERALKAGNAWRRKVSRERKREIAMMGVAARKAKREHSS